MEKFVRMVAFVPHLRTETGNLSELKLPYKVSYTVEGMLINAFFRAQISFHFSLGISLSYFHAHLSDPLAFSVA